MTEDSGSLTAGMCQSIVNGEVLQGYLQIKNVNTNGNKTMLTVHDSKHSIKIPLPSNHNNLLSKMKPGAILEIHSYNCTTMSGQKTCILQQIAVIQEECEDLGPNAQVLDQSASSSGNNNSAPSAMFGGPPQKNQQKRSGGSGKLEKGCTPIAGLSPYVNTWKLKVRCTEKDEKMKEWSNARSTGKLFSFVIMDHAGTEIRCTAFNDEAEKFFNTIVKNKVYYISKGRVKVSTFKTRVKNDYEINIGRDTKITLCNDDAGFSERQFDFVSIGDIEQSEDKSFIDVIAIVKECSELSEFTSKAGKELKNRKLTLIDTSSKTIEATIWNDAAVEWTNESLPPGTVVILPGCRVGSYGGRSLSVNTVLTEGNPPQKEQLLTWWKQGGCEAESISLTTRGGGKAAEQLSWMDAVNQDKGRNPQGKDDYKGCYFNVRGFITHYAANFEKPPYYLACPESANSMAKVEEQDGQWFCAKTNETYSSYRPRFVLRFQVADWTTGNYVSSFNEQAETIVNCSAVDVEKLVKQGDEDGFNDVFKQKLWQQGNFKIRAKEDTWEDQARVRYDVISVSAVNYVQECKSRIDLLMGL